MAMPVVIAKNQTGSDIDLDRLGLRVPASPGQLTLTEFATYTECTEDDTLEAAVSSGDIVINDGTSDLTVAEGLVYLNSAGNLDGPATGAATNTLLKLSDTSGTKTEATGITVDASDNMTVPGTLEAGGLTVGGDPLGHDDLEAPTLAWTSSGHTGTASRVAAFGGGGAATELQIGVDLQAWDTDLQALANLSSTGIFVRSGSGAAITRSIVQPAAGITVTDGDGVAGDPTLALADDLAAVEGLAGSGFAVRTGTSTWAERSLTAPAAGFTISNPDGVASGPVFALSDDLAALEAQAGTGLVTRTAADTYDQRTLAGTAGAITVTNGDGIAGNPTINVGANVIQTTTALGGDLAGNLPNPTVTDLTISGEVQGDLLYNNGTNWVNLPPGTAGQFLQTDGAGSNPVWADSTVFLEDEGTPVAGGPHSTLNFTGDGVEVTDAGSGEATINIPGFADDLPSVQARRTSTFTPSASFGDVTLDTTDVENDPATIDHSDTLRDRITVLEDGLYLITYHTVWDPGNNDNCQVQIRINDSVVIPGTLQTLNSGGGGPADPEGIAISATVVRELTANDFLTFQARANGGDLLSGLTVTVTRARATRGPAGPQGPAGSGSTVQVEDEGVVVSGGPFDTLDFVGAGVSVTGAGGTATVTIPGGGGGGGTPNIAQYRQSTNLTINTTATTVGLNATDFEDSNYTRSGSDITINTAGIYKVSYSIYFDTNANSRRTVDGWVENNTVEIIPSRSAGYARNNTDDTCSLSATFFVSLAASDVLRLRAQSTGTGGTALGEANRMWIALEFVRSP